jgi:hypothetical protein
VELALAAARRDAQSLAKLMAALRLRSFAASVEIAQAEQQLAQAKKDARDQLAQAQQHSAFVGLSEGLSFLCTRRIDISDERFGDVDPEQALKIAAACGRELKELFLPVPLLLSPEALTQLKKACPQARCLALGGEVTAAGFEKILRQYKEPDAEMANALAIAEGLPPPSACTLEGEPFAAPQAAAAAAGRHITPSPQEACGTADCHTLDLTDAVQFRHLTDAGLGAFAAICYAFARKFTVCVLCQRRSQRCAPNSAPSFCRPTPT